MIILKGKYLLGISIISFILLMTACSPEAGYKVKSFFLDGVPNPFDEIELVEIDSTQTISNDSIRSTAEVIINKPEWYVHPPYKARKCYDCHLEGSRGRLKIPKDELCFKCHTNIGDGYSAMHGPFASGNCTQCHSPHQSKIETLLLAKSSSLCFKCHDETKVKGYAIHTSIGDTECMTCHNPHGGENKFFLQSNACYQCHDNFEEKYTYVHGPVAAGGLCSACHDNHQSGKPKLLSISGRDLCFSCHNETDIKRNPAHSRYKKQECTDCHSPHGSDQAYFLTKIIGR